MYTATELDALYDGLQAKDKALTGLIIYQGLKTIELEHLELLHLNLKAARITVPALAKSNPRILNLEAKQLMDLQAHLQSKTDSHRLFKSSLNNHMHGLIKRIQEEEEGFKSPSQLRQSRIAIWVKQHGLRKAQYMAGHRYVSSTERYQQVDQEALQSELERCHPMR